MPDAAEKDRQPQIEKLENRREDIRILPEIAGLAAPHLHDRMPDIQQQRKQRQHIDPRAASGEKRLAQLQTNHRQDLSQPQVHLLGSSPPIRYSYSELTSSSAGATDSIPTPFSAILFNIR